MPTSGDRAATDPTTLYHDLLAAIRDALAIPLAAYTDLDAEQTLRNRRTMAVETAVQMALKYGNLASEAELLRRRIDQLPVMYRRHIGTAPDNPDDCIICGPGRCAPILGIHGARPGPHSGAEVVGVR